MEREIKLSFASTYSGIGKRTYGMTTVELHGEMEYLIAAVVVCMKDNGQVRDIILIAAHMFLEGDTPTVDSVFTV